MMREWFNWEIEEHIMLTNNLFRFDTFCTSDEK